MDLFYFLVCITQLGALIVFQERVTLYEGIVKAQQSYQGALSESQEWLANMQERLQVCTDMSGDRHTVQNRLDRLQVGCYGALLVICG